MQWTRDHFNLYDERDKVDTQAVHAMLAEAYWAKGRTIQTVQATIDGCLCFSLYERSRQIGFARVLTDYATYGVILDVVIQKEYRGLGLGLWMMTCMTNHPAIVSLKQVLWTSNAEGLYEQLGFSVPEKVRFMIKPARD